MKNIFFLHLTRTGGKGLIASLIRSKKYQIIEISKFFPEISLSTNQVKKEKIIHFLENSKSFKKPLIISGHMNLDRYFLEKKDFKTFTLLRNPYYRIRSQINYFLDSNETSHSKNIFQNLGDIKEIINNPKISKKLIEDSDLEEYDKETFLLMLSNGQCRQISDVSYREKIKNEDLLCMTLDRLSQIDFITTSENTLNNFKQIKKFLKLPIYYHMTKTNISSNQFNQETKINKTIIEMNKLDNLIWKIIFNFENNYLKISKNNLLGCIECCDEFTFRNLKMFKGRIINIFERFIELKNSY